jgi:hypothetical protein
MFFSLSVYAQPQTDTSKTHHADRGAKQFAAVVKSYIGRIGRSVNMDSIRLIAVSLRKQADTLIREVKWAYRINDEALSEANRYTNLANDCVNTKPSIATSYLTMAENKRNESGEQPDYFDALEHIEDLANRLTGSKKLDRAKKLNMQMEDSSKELSMETK